MSRIRKLSINQYKKNSIFFKVDEIDYNLFNLMLNS